MWIFLLKNIQSANEELKKASDEIHIIEELAINGQQRQEAIAIEEVLKVYTKHLHEAEDYILKGNKEEAKHILLNEASKDFEEMRKLLHILEEDIAHLEHEAQQHVYLALLEEKIVVVVMLLLSLVIAGISISLSFKVLKAMQNSVKTLTKASSDLDLCFVLPTDGKTEVSELNKAITSFKEAIRKSMKIATDTSTTVGSAANQLAVSSEEINKTLTIQTDRVQNVEQTMAESTESIRTVSQRLKETEQQSTEVMNQAEIAETNMKELQDKSDEIGQVISVIQDISDQVNLLALNAAIEAARAGDAGRGFAVVADEVRKLAAQTSTSAGNIQEGMNELHSTVTRCFDSLNVITKAIEANNTAIQEITLSSTTQTESVEKVRNIMGELSENIRNNLSSVEQSTAATGMLAEEAGKLEEE
ncbi:MAG: methyl-accepting chemotaxis protein, partial [Alphaproteobacteria bacterium]|nr:methyl-accepting chemotaxis protein [Alphaproteobacteria bacterium]